MASITEQRKRLKWGQNYLKSFVCKLMYIKDLCCHYCFYAIAVDVIAKYERDCLMSNILYGGDLVLKSEGMEKFLKWKEAFESKMLKVKIEKTNLMVSNSKAELLQSKVDSYANCGPRNMVNSVPCMKYGTLVHGRYTKIKSDFISGNGFCM